MNVDWIIFFVGISNLLISWLVWRSNPKEKLNTFFGLFGFITFLQIIFDFIFRFIPTLFILRCSYAFAALIPIAASLWIFEICNFSIKRKWLRFLYFSPGLIFFVITFIDGLIVKEINGLSLLGYKGVLGPLFYVYTFYFVAYVAFFTILLYKNQRISEKKSDFLRRTQLNYILCGILLYSGFATTFSLVLPIFYNTYDYTLLDAPSFIFFVGFTGYAITKHHLFDVRLIATELFTFIIWIILFVKTLLSKDPQDLLINVGLLLAMVIFGVLLIRSVIKEVEQKEEIKKMAEGIEKAYEVEKKANDELKKLDEYKNDFMRQAQHDLRTPLTVMMGYSDLLLDGSYGKLPKQAADVIKRIISVTQGKLEDINNFLDSEQFKMGKGVVLLKPGVELAPILEEIMNVLNPKAKEKGIYIKLEKSKKAFTINADRGKLKSAIFNVIDNAIKYTPKGGVTIKTENHDSVKIIISDTGIGMPKDKIKNMLETQFERTKEAEKTASGSGVGLYLSGQIIKLHNGKIWAESEGENKGSTFHIELPIEKKEEK